MHSLGIVHWNSTRRDHPGNPGGVSGSGLISYHCGKLGHMKINCKFLRQGIDNMNTAATTSTNDDEVTLL